MYTKKILKESIARVENEAVEYGDGNVEMQMGYLIGAYKALLDLVLIQLPDKEVTHDS